METDANILLQDRAAIIVAASVWYHEDIIEVLRKSSEKKNFFDRIISQVNIACRVHKNILTLPLTALTKQHVQDLSVFVEKGIRNWTQNHNFLNIPSTVLYSLISWNPKCVIDCIETAKNIISYENNVINQFRIACMYCLENYIFQLWELVKNHYLQDNISVMECFEVRFWITYIKHDMHTFMNEMQYIGNRDNLWFAFNMSVTNNNEIWIEHFLKKMKEDQLCIETTAYRKLKYILEMPATFNYAMIPILSRYTSHEMLNDLMLSYSGTILLQFLKFPNTSKFIKLANKTWGVLSTEDFFKIIEVIGCCLQEYDGNKIFKNTLVEFWNNSPDHCKSYVIQKCIDGSFLNRLGLRKRSSPIVKLIIQSSTADQRKEMIFSCKGILFLDSLKQKNRWGCFSMSLTEFAGSDNKEEWMNELISTYKHILKMNQFYSITSEDLKNLIEILEKKTCFFTDLSTTAITLCQAIQ